MTNRLLPVLCSLSLLSFPALAQPAAPPPSGQAAALPSLAPLVESVKASVVNVDVQKKMLNDEQMEAFERFFKGRRGREEAPLNPGSGSGFIVDPRGLVITNNHVIEGAVTIKVRLDDGRSFDGEVLGRDPLTDVALVKLKGSVPNGDKGKVEGLPSVKLGDSSVMRVGDWVVAIGNPFGLASSVSAGIISASDRQIGASRYDQFLQTDAAINPGNSGGPLFNLKGEVIGMNTAIIGAATGIGFAVPSSLIKAIVPQLEKDGHVTRGWLGVAIQDVGPTLGKALGLPVRDGALVTSVNEGSPAAKAGLREEDVIVTIDGEKVGSSNGLTRTVALKRPDATVTLGLYRGGKLIEVKVKLGVRPDLEGLGELEKKSPGTGEPKQRLGLSFQDIDPRMADAAGLPKQGALIVEVAPGSPAEEAGLKRGMVVTEVNRKPIRARDDFAQALKEAKPGSAALLRVAVPGVSNRSLVAIDIP